MRRTRHTQPLRVGYVSGAESFPLMMAALLPEPDLLGRPLELVEYVGLLSMRKAFERSKIDFALMDSVEAFRMSRGEMRIGLLVRGCQVRIAVSERVRGLGGATPGALTHLFHHRILNKALRIGVSDVGGSVELYSMEFVRSVGKNWIEQIHLPAALLEEALKDGLIDGYFQLDSPFGEMGFGDEISGKELNPMSVRREMALVADRQTWVEYKEDYVRLVAAMLRGQERLVDGDCSAELSEFSGLPKELIADEVREVFQQGRMDVGMDPGVLSARMAGGLIEPVQQWEVVVSERLKRIRTHEESPLEAGIIIEGLVSEAKSLLS